MDIERNNQGIVFAQQMQNGGCGLDLTLQNIVRFINYANGTSYYINSKTGDTNILNSTVDTRILNLETWQGLVESLVLLTSTGALGAAGTEINTLHSFQANVQSLVFATSYGALGAAGAQINSSLTWQNLVESLVLLTSTGALGAAGTEINTLHNFQVNVQSLVLLTSTGALGAAGTQINTNTSWKGLVQSGILATSTAALGAAGTEINTLHSFQANVQSLVLVTSTGALGAAGTEINTLHTFQANAQSLVFATSYGALGACGTQVNTNKGDIEDLQDFNEHIQFQGNNMALQATNYTIGPTAVYGVMIGYDSSSAVTNTPNRSVLVGSFTCQQSPQYSACLGHCAGWNSTLWRSVCIGAYAGLGNGNLSNTLNECVSLGAYTHYTLSSGVTLSRCFAMCAGAQQNCTGNATNCIAMGYRCQFNLAAVDDCFAAGSQSQLNCNDSHTISIGDGSMYSGGLRSICLGIDAGGGIKQIDTIVIGHYGPTNSAQYSIMIGNYTGAYLTSKNLCIGHNTCRGSSLALSAGVINNICLGDNQLISGVNAARNILIGHSIGQTNNGCDDNVVIGNQAGTALFCDKSVFIGALSKQGGGGGSESVGIGYKALQNSPGETNSKNVAVGSNSMEFLNYTANENALLGYVTGQYIRGSRNAAVGAYAGTNMTDDNVFVGYFSGQVSTGSQNVYVGSQTIGNASNDTDEVIIGYNLTGKGSNTSFIGSNGGGPIYNTQNSSTWNVTSDQRLKKNIQNYKKGLNEIQQLQCKTFEYREKEEIEELPQKYAINKKGVQIGLIAQELEKIFPESVTTDQNGVKGIQYDELVFGLINAVKELSQQNDQKTRQIQNLEIQMKKMALILQNQK